MTSEQRTDEFGNDDDLNSSEAMSRAMSEAGNPKPPSNLPDSECEGLRRRATELVLELAAAEGSTEMELIDNVTNVGLRAQKNGGSQFELLRVRVREMLSVGGPGRDITGSLVDLRMTLDEINPNALTRPGIVRTLTSILPFVSRITPPLKILRKIAIRYEPVSKQIDVIEAKLREGRMVLTRDNVELRQVYEKVEEERLPIQKNAYLGELLIVQLQEQLERTDDSAKAEIMLKS